MKPTTSAQEYCFFFPFYSPKSSIRVDAYILKEIISWTAVTQLAGVMISYLLQKTKLLAERRCWKNAVEAKNQGKHLI